MGYIGYNSRGWTEIFDIMLESYLYIQYFNMHGIVLRSLWSLKANLTILVGRVPT